MAYCIKTISALVIVLISVASAQIPNFGRCPNYDSMANFDRENFLGKWYEFERYFTVSELAAKCIAVEYERRSDGKIYANNVNTNRFTGVQRIVTGVLSVTGKNDEATFTIKYQALPVNYDTTIHVLDTDYDSYAVLWSCSSVVGPVGHTESAWIMTRERNPDGPVLQAAYGVLDKYKISRTFFVKTDQTDCETKGAAEEAADDNSNSGYDIVVDDDTVSDELFVNHYGNVPNLYENNNMYYRENGLNATAKANGTSTTIESTTNATNIKTE